MADPIDLALIDDDAAVLDALLHYLTRERVKTSCFDAAESFLMTINQGARFDRIVCDIRMPGMTGLDLMRQVNERAYAPPVILITGHGDVEMAVNAIRDGAFDFIEKPFDEARLLASIHRAVKQDRQREVAAAELKELQSRFNTLSVRQRQVMELAADGLSNKEIAIKLNVSPRTIESHRAWVMERMGARNLAELIRMVMKLQARNERSK
jgi:two-component system, LuxR family, response regulator FixJ